MVGRRRKANLWLATFLILIGVNQAAEALRVNDLDFHGWATAAAFVSSALDPAVLYAFARAYPEAEKVGPSRTAFWLGTVSGVLALGSLAVYPLEAVHPARQLWGGALSGFMIVAYTLVLVRFAAAAGDPRRSGRSVILFFALCIALMPRWTILLEVASVILDVLDLQWWGPLGQWRSVVSFLVVAAIGVPAMRKVMPARKTLAIGLACGLAATIVTHAARWLQEVPLLAPLSSNSLVLAGHRYAVQIRWILFCTVASIALFRYHGAETPLSRRRWTARLFLGGLLLMVLVGPLVEVARRISLSLPTGLVIVALLLGASLLVQSVRPAVDSMARLLYGFSSKAIDVAPADSYRDGVVRTVHAGRVVSGNVDLLRLRRDLGLDDVSASAIERVVEERLEGDFRPGQVVGGRYRIEARLGAGSQGAAYRAFDERLRRQVVLKRLRVPAGTQGLREGQMAARLGHPGVVAIYDLYPTGESVWIVQEYIAGGTLADLLADGRRFPLERGREWAALLMDGVAHVHQAGILHLDLKPSNVLLDRSGNPKIADFGSARVTGGTLAQGGTELGGGTLGFLGPEQLKGLPGTAASDQYSLAKILVLSLPEKLPPNVQKVLSRAMEPRPEKRWPSVAAMRTAWLRASATGTKTATTSSRSG